LRTIHEVGTGDWADLWKMHFQSLRLDFTAGPSLAIQRGPEGLSVRVGDQVVNLDPSKFPTLDIDSLRRSHRIVRVSDDLYEFDESLYTREGLEGVLIERAMKEIDAPWLTAA